MPDFSNRKLVALLAIFVGLVIAMNLLGGKLTTLFGVTASVAIFMVPLTFLITDVVEEVYGRKVTKQFVWAGMITLVMIMGYTLLSVALPPADRYLENNDAYKTIFGGSLRIMLASLIAFGVSQLHDVWAFNFWKQKTGGRHLWLRNNLSTWVSQAIDSLLFMFIAFYQITPAYTAAFVISIAIPYYLLKISFAALDTPLVYLGVRWLKKS